MRQIYFDHLIFRLVLQFTRAFERTLLAALKAQVELAYLDQKYDSALYGASLHLKFLKFQARSSCSRLPENYPQTFRWKYCWIIDSFSKVHFPKQPVPRNRTEQAQKLKVQKRCVWANLWDLQNKRQRQQFFGTGWTFQLRIQKCLQKNVSKQDLIKQFFIFFELQWS